MSAGGERRDVRAWARNAVAAVTRDWPASVAIGLLAVAVVATALFAPSTQAGGVSLVLLVAAAGAGLAWAAAHIPSRSAPGFLGPALAYLIVFTVAVIAFHSPWFDTGLYIHDWGTHHAVTQSLLDGLRGGHVPTWANDMSTGDAPLELYPALTYYIAAGLALLFHTSDTAMVLARLAIAVQVLLALGTVRLALRFVSWRLAVVAGLLVLLDRGNGTSGGASAVLYWGLLHNGVALCLWVFALGSLVNALRRPRLGSSLAVWVLGALGVAAHPIGLVTAAATAVALLAVAALARDLPPRRALVGVFHVVVAVALAAVVWQPLAERLLHYGVHYGASPTSNPVMFRTFTQHPLPAATFAVAVYLGYLGILAGVFSRRSAPTLIAFFAGVLLVGVSTEPYLLLHLGPSSAFARFSSTRLMSVAKVPVFISAVYLVQIVAAHLRGRWQGPSRLLAGAVAALLLAWTARVATPFLNDHFDALERDAGARIPGEHDMAALRAWARSEVDAMTPDRFGRLLYDTTSNAVFHLQAETGLPIVSTGAISDLLLRERMNSVSPANLRRFDIRWVMQYGKSPRIGDPKTERRIGGFRIREVAGWDGRLARVERGGGQAVVTRLEDERIDVDLRGTDQPALVALGIGYYPRWRARDDRGRAIPVYALPAVPGGKTHVIAAWLPPGRTVFRPDGSLPSDGKGRGLTGLAALLVVGLVIVWSRPRLRIRLLRRTAVARRWLRHWWARRRRVVALASAVVAALALLVGGWLAGHRPTLALQVGHGLVGSARVEARRNGGEWVDCPYDSIVASYHCDNMIDVQDEIGQLVNDAAPSWPLVTPMITAQATGGKTEFRIHLRARLDGDYWAATKRGAVSLTVGKDPPKRLGRQTRLTYHNSGRREVTLQGATDGKALQLALVLIDAVSPDPDYPIPPQAPPAALTGADH